MAKIILQIPEYENFKGFEAEISPRLAYKVFKMVTRPFKAETKTEQ